MPMAFASRSSYDRFQWCMSFAAVISLLIFISCRSTTASEVCPIGTYGAACDKGCHCKNDIPCDRTTGRCPDGCYGNWTGSACNITTVSHQYIGCYRDEHYIRAMEFRYSDNKVNNTLQSCSEACAEGNYSYAGLQYGYNCFCGDSYDRHGVSTACTMRCPGDHKTICGGTYANSVYSVCPVGSYGQLCTGVCRCLNNERCFYRNGSCPSTKCEDGWNGPSCNIRNKCSMKPCDTASTICINTIGGYNCSCKRGFHVHNATTCIDIDECEENTCDNSTTECHNAPGSYKCIGKQGFSNSHNCTGERTIIAGVIGLLIGVALTLAAGFAVYQICRQKYRNGAVSEKKSSDPKPPEPNGYETEHVGLRPRKSEVQNSSRNKPSDKVTPFATGKSADYVNVQCQLSRFVKDEAVLNIDADVNTYESLNVGVSGFDETRIYADLINTTLKKSP